MDSSLPPASTTPLESPEPSDSSSSSSSPIPPPLSSISISLSSLLSSPTSRLHLLPSKPPTPTKNKTAATTTTTGKVKIPTQISSLLLSLSPPPLPSLPSRLSLSAPSTLPSPLLPLPRLPSDPSAPLAARRCSLLWFRNDLRLHDNEALTSASNDSLSLLPVFLFDPRDFGRSPSGFDKTGPYRASFLLQSVSNLRDNLRSRGSDLVVRIGRPETVLVELARAIGADALYAHREVSHDEVRAEERVEKAMEEEGVEVKFFWGSTLYHVDDLPFDVEQMPTNYGGFRERVQGLAVRKTIEALDQVKGLPTRGNVEVGEIPSLADLGLKPTAAVAQDGQPAVNASLVGGETEALERLKRFAAECRVQSQKDSNRESIFGANFSCKISPWLAMGCLSPRFMFDELKKTAPRAKSTSQRNGGTSGDSRMNWLMFELLWRDFFRFITKKYSSGKKKLDVVPATACV